MTDLQQKTKAVRKTFTIPRYLADELETYAHQTNTKQSQIVSSAIEQFVTSQIHSAKVQKRLNALENLIGIAPKGSLEHLDKKQVREERAKKNAH